MPVPSIFSPDARAQPKKLPSGKTQQEEKKKNRNLIRAQLPLSWLTHSLMWFPASSHCFSAVGLMPAFPSLLELLPAPWQEGSHPPFLQGLSSGVLELPHHCCPMEHFPPTFRSQLWTRNTQTQKNEPLLC